MGNGTLKTIEDIEPGDYVLAHDVETGQWRPQLVLDQWSHVDDGHMATVTIEDGSSVTATDYHQFWNETNQTWTELDSVEVGDMLLSPTGPIEVTNLSVADATHTLVWEITVQTDHNFTASTGTEEVLVHNCGDGFSAPSSKFDFNDPTRPPGDDWSWAGQPPEGGDKGAWTRRYPDGTNESLHPDLSHGGDIGPHRDWNSRDGGRYRIDADGTITPK